MQNISAQLKKVACLGLGSLSFSLTACKSDKSESGQTAVSESKIELTAFPNLANLIRALKAKPQTLTSEQTDQYIQKLIASWVSDLNKNKIDTSNLASNPIDACEQLTAKSLSLGYFIIPEVNNLGHNRYSPGIGIYKVSQFPADSALLGNIQIAGKTPAKNKSKVNFYKVTAEINDAPTAFIATTNRVKDDYFVIINPDALGYTAKMIAGKNGNLPDLTQKLQQLCLYNELSLVALDSFFKEQGIYNFRDPTIRLGPDQENLFDLIQLYEAFSDLCSWQYAKFPMWGHLQMLEQQAQVGAPKSYELTRKMQTTIALKVINTDAELAKVMDRSFPPNTQVTLGMIIPLLQANPSLDQHLKARVVDMLEIAVNSCVLSAAKSMQAEQGR